MKYQKKTIAVITARGGSKRIKNKNILNFFGKPMIAYSIIAAKKSKLFDKIYISTDSRKIKKISEKYGGKVPFLREKKLSDDFTGTHEVVKNFLEKAKIKKEFICCIYPTAPLMRSWDLVRGFNKLLKNKNSYIYSANIKKQTYKHKFVDSGQFYWGTLKTWINKKNILQKRSIKIKIPIKYSQDLNNYEDLKILINKKLANHE
mgnify:CR=1 FL=1